jgi:hypothetical protein
MGSSISMPCEWALCSRESRPGRSLSTLYFLYLYFLYLYFLGREAHARYTVRGTTKFHRLM